LLPFPLPLPLPLLPGGPFGGFTSGAMASAPGL
jgi:hypothetical protein